MLHARLTGRARGTVIADPTGPRARATCWPRPEGNWPGPTAMQDFWGTSAKVHRDNIERYCRLLATPLSEVERAYLPRRIAEERAELERLQWGDSNDAALCPA